LSFSFDAHSIPKRKVNEVFEVIEKQNPDAVCIVAVAPFVLSHARFLCAKIRDRKPELPIVICILGLSEIDPQIPDKLNPAGATKIVYALSQAVDALKEMQSTKESNQE
jgi:hypothetical protein